MYVVWRKRPVKAKGGGPFLLINPLYVDAPTAWMPMRCEHRGADRIAHTPLVVESSRFGFGFGEPIPCNQTPRQKVLQRLPTIRSCCIADSFARAAWWHRVNGLIECWDESFSDDPRFIHFSRDVPDIRRKLRAVVPAPTARGVAEFTAYRLPLEQAFKAAMDAERQWQKKESDAWWERHRREQEEAKRSQSERIREEYERIRKEFEAMFAGSSIDQCFVVLGLKPTASLDEVKGRYRELAKEHHPDKGGDQRKFVEIKAAYDRACEILGRRATA